MPLDRFGTGISKVLRMFCVTFSLRAILLIFSRLAQTASSAQPASTESTEDRVQRLTTAVAQAQAQMTAYQTQMLELQRQLAALQQQLAAENDPEHPPLRPHRRSPENPRRRGHRRLRLRRCASARRSRTPR